MSRTAGAPCLVLCTCPDAAVAARIAAALVDRRLAASVNRVPGIVSVYRWEGAVHGRGEELLIVKTTAACYQRVEATIVELHPYRVPQVLRVAIDGGLEAYLDWIGSSTVPADSPA